MIRELGKYTLIFFVLVLLQVLILNNVQLSGYINPYMYVLFILLLPFETPRYLVLLLAFVLGLSIDLFSNTPGIHSSATVFMAFLRPFVIDLISAREVMDKAVSPRISQMGFGWFFRYVLILIICHHIFLFYIEVFTFNGALHTLMRSLLSSVFSIILVVISQYIVFRN